MNILFQACFCHNNITRKGRGNGKKSGEYVTHSFHGQRTFSCALCVHIQWICAWKSAPHALSIIASQPSSTESSPLSQSFVRICLLHEFRATYLHPPAIPEALFASKSLLLAKKMAKNHLRLWQSVLSWWKGELSSWFSNGLECNQVINILIGCFTEPCKNVGLLTAIRTLIAFFGFISCRWILFETF